MKTLPAQDVIYAFSNKHEPILRAAAGDTVKIDTFDCFKNQIQSSDQEVATIDWDQVNPATGPIFIEGAEIGDVLKVVIKDLEIGDQGVMVTGPKLGVMGHRMTAMESKIIPIQNGKAVFSERLQLPLNPMIGVIGVAPEGEPVSCGTPGSHGGNMDTKLITKGATLYFPVAVDGALFALGDFHAAMGDGEISVSGIEVPGSATVQFDVIKDGRLKHPLLENEEGLSFLVSAMTLDEAVSTAVEEMIDLLLTQSDLSVSEMTMLMSAAGEAQISQVVDPLVTARFFVPRHVLEGLNFHLFA